MAPSKNRRLIELEFEMLRSKKSRQRKVLERIGSLRQKHREMRVFNNFENVEAWKPVLNPFFDREKGL